MPRRQSETWSVGRQPFDRGSPGNDLFRFRSEGRRRASRRVDVGSPVNDGHATGGTQYVRCSPQHRDRVLTVQQIGL